MSERGCPGEGRSFGHVGESEGNHFVIGIVYLVVDEEVEAYCIQPLVVGSVKGFWCSNVEFSGFRGGHW